MDFYIQKSPETINCLGTDHLIRGTTRIEKAIYASPLFPLTQDNEQL